MDLPWGAFGAFLLEPVVYASQLAARARPRPPQDGFAAASLSIKKMSAGFLLLPSNF
jgi:hypothetical protein